MKLFAQGGAAPLAVFLLSAAEQTLDREQLKPMLQRTSELIAGYYRERLPEVPSEEKLNALIGLLREEGAVIEIEPIDDDSSEIVLHRRSCPFMGIDPGEGHACLLDEQLFSRVLDRPVRRIKCRTEGECCCCFAIAKS